MKLYLYRFLWYVLWPVLWIRIFLRARREPVYGERALERFAWYHPTHRLSSRPIWIHAVSLGETRAIAPLVNDLVGQGRLVLLTSTTATGRTEGARLFAQEIAQGAVIQAWMPYDSYGAVKRFLTHFNPSLAIFMETEVWPEMMTQAHQGHLKTCLVSARLSERSMLRALKVGNLLIQAYRDLSLILAQTELDAQRLQILTGRDDIQVVGNLKFDVHLSDEDQAAGKQWRHALARPVIAMASTREGEEELFVQAISNLYALHPHVLFVLIPRHPQRFESTGALLYKAGINFRYRSALRWGEPISSDTVCIVGDSVGEMAKYYGLADVAIIAGSFLPLGGQNHIEACACGVPVIVGPHTFNFAQATELACSYGAAIQVMTAHDAVVQALALIENDMMRERMSHAAFNFTQHNQGALQRIVQALGFGASSV